MGRALLLQDVPFSVVNVLFFLRTVSDRNPGGTGPCSESYNRTTFVLLLLVLLTSIASLTYKLMKLVPFPAVWHERSRLRCVYAELLERSCRLEAEAVAQQGSDSDSDSDSGDGDGDGDGGGGGGGEAPVAKPNTASQPSQLALQSGSSGMQPRTVVVELTTFEIGMLPECGR